MAKDIFEVIGILKEAAEKRFLAEIYYRKLSKNGGGVKRIECEPYEIKDGSVFCWHIEDDTIKNYKLSNIENAAITSRPWNVPIDHMRASFARKIIGETEVKTQNGNDAINKTGD